jgi:hypothetical protein
MNKLWFWNLGLMVTAPHDGSQSSEGWFSAASKLETESNLYKIVRSSVFPCVAFGLSLALKCSKIFCVSCNFHSLKKNILDPFLKTLRNFQLHPI